MKLIDGDALKASLKESADRCREWIKDCADQKDDVMQRLAEQALLTFNECAMRIDSMPTVEPKCEPTMEEFMYGQDMGNPEDGSL